MPLRYLEFQVPEKTIRQGGKDVVLPAHWAVKVLRPHTIFNLRRQRQKEARNERKYGRTIANAIKVGTLRIEDGAVVESDPWGVQPDRKVGINSRVMDYLKKKFGFY